MDAHTAELKRQYEEHGCWHCDQGYEDEDCTCWVTILWEKK